MNICSPIPKHCLPFSDTGRIHNIFAIDCNKCSVNFTGSNFFRLQKPNHASHLTVGGIWYRCVHCHNPLHSQREKFRCTNCTKWLSTLYEHTIWLIWYNGTTARVVCANVLYFPNVPHTYFNSVHVSSNFALINRGINCIIQPLVYVTVCRWPFRVQVGKELSDLHTKRSPTQSDIYQKLCWYNWFSWWGRGCTKHVENWNKYIEKNCASSWSFTMNNNRMHAQQYTGCPRRNGQNFGRVFLMLNYIDITQNTYIQSWTVTEIMARDVWNFDSCYTLIDYQIHIKTGRNMWFL